MKKNLKWIVFVCVLLLAAIGLLVTRNLGSHASAALSVQVTPAPAGPQVIAQEPIAGERLPLSPVIKLTFDRAMDRAKTGAAFSLRAPEGSVVPGKMAWLDPQTFQFTPDSPLKPATVYRAVFAASAAAADGASPADPIQLEFTTAETLQVSQVFPAVDADDVDPTTNITVIFNHPVVPLGIQEDQASLPQPLELSPQVAGQGRWLNTSVYLFQPDPAFVGGIRYTVRVGSGLKDTTGNALPASYVSQFTTRAAGIANFLVKNGPSNPPLDNLQGILLDQAFVITFTQPMKPDVVARELSITNRETNVAVPLALTWNDDFTVLTIQPRGRYAIASFYDLLLSKDAQAADGGSLKEPYAVHFSTVPLPQVVRIDPPSTEKGFDSTLSIKFASPMKADSLKGRVLITPAPSGTLQWYYSDYDWTYRTYGLDPGTEYVVRVLPGMADLYGNTIGTESSLGFHTADKSPYAQVVLPWTPLVYRAHGPQDVYFEYLNVDSASVSLYPLTFSEFTGLLKQDDKTTFSPQTQPLREWNPDTVPPKNQLGRKHIQLQDQKGNPLQPGYYLLGVKSPSLSYTGNFYQAGLFVVATDNLTFKATSSEGLAWVVDLESGKPQANVPVMFYDKDFAQLGKTSSTDRNGLVYLPGIGAPMYARVEGTGHLAFVATDWGSGVWAGDLGIEQNYYGNTSAPFAYLYTDRPVYRPGQDVYFKGLVRQNDDLHYTLLEDAQVHVTIDESGDKVYTKDLPLSKLGSIQGDFKLSDDAALGTYTISVSKSPTADPFSSLTFRVAEYHKPTFQVAASSDKADVLSGDQVHFGLDAAYYSGGNVGNAQVNWFTEASGYVFDPGPKFSQFSFSDWDRDVYNTSPNGRPYGGTLAEGKAVTDSNGHLDLSQTPPTLADAKADQQVTFNANVTDVAGDVVAAQTSVVIHQSKLYGGVRSLSYVGTQGKSQPFEIVVLDWDSHPIAGQSVSVKFVQRQWFSVQKQDKQGQLSWVTSVKDILVSQQKVTTGEDGKAQASFVPSSGGVYKAIVVVTDAAGHSQQSSAYTWVASDEPIAWRQTNDRSFNLIADKDTYSPGDTAELLIAQPFQGSVYALVTYERGHIYKQDVVLLTGNSTVYRLPITVDMSPAAYVSVVVVSGADNSKTPDFKVGMARLNVDTSQRALDVKVASDKKNAGPGDTVTYTVTTKDPVGKPVSADVSVAVVDKAALALAPSNSGPILDSFYPLQALGVQTSLGLVANADDFNAQYRESIPEGGGSGGGGADNSLGILTVRQDFKDTAFFQAEVTTGVDGTAQVSVKLPENLTTWVADARAATADAHVGQATSELVSSKPLFVELQTPRFFVAGDAAHVGAVVHNNGADPLKVSVSLTVQGVQLADAAAQSVSVAGKSQAYVTWDVRVDENAQRVDLTAQAVSGSFSDSSKPSLGTLSGQGIPVYTYTAVETVGTSGLLTAANSATEGIRLPSSDFTDAHLSVDVSPSLAASMQAGLTYLQDYPYLCMEQTVSAFLPNVVTTRALKLAGVPRPALQAGLDQQVSSALQRIYAKQKSDGGWNWWDGPDSDPQTSAYVVLGLLEAKDSGYSVSQSVLDNGMQYVKGNLPNIYINASTSDFNRYAFMLYVLARGQALQPGVTNVVYNQRSSLSLFGEGYLVQALYMLNKEDPRIQSLMSDLAGAVVMSSTGAHWEEKGQADYWSWNTDTRTTAIVLDAFIQVDPQNPIAVNAVRWLMAHRDSGHWHSTQETAWSLIALTNWLTATREYASDYQWAVGLNGASLQQGQVTKTNLTDTVKLRIENKDMLKDVLNYLVFTRGSGNGNLYYDAYLSTTLPVENIAPLDQGVSLSRQYFTLSDLKKPITQIQHGQLLRIRLTVVVPASLHYIVIDDPLPAGLEAINSTILTDTTVPSKYTVQDYDERGWGWWYFTHIERRDEKIVLSTDYLPAGTYVYTYLARASSAGTFKVIPPTASEFYFPDVGGRGAGSIFTVTP